MDNKAIFGMISNEEREYLQEYAKNHYSGKGSIVDLGCWLGVSSIALVTGLTENPNVQAKESIIHAYDLFIWEEWMNQFVVGTELEGKYQPGDSFFEECVRQTLRWNNQIKFYSGDLNQVKWGGSPIEFLFIDAMKSWELANSIIQNFFPALIPKHSIIVHQDFSHYGTYWIHLVMYRLRQYFEPVYDLPNSWSFVFKYREAIPDILLKSSYSLSDFSVDEIHSAFKYSQQIVSPEKRSQLIGAKIVALLNLGDVNQAWLEVEKAKAEGYSYADLEIPLGLGLPSVIIDFFRSKQIAVKSSSSYQKNPHLATENLPNSESKLLLKYTGERHIALPVGDDLSISNLFHMIRYAFVAPFIKEKQVLDISCGSGYGTQYMAIQGAKQVVGVDIDANSIEFARRFHAHESAVYIQSDAHFVEQLKDNSFDVIVSFETIEHVEKPREFLIELRRLLKPDGQVFISCPNDYRISPWLSPFHLHKFKFSEFRELFVSIFGQGTFLGQHNTIASCLFKPMMTSTTVSQFENYKQPLPINYCGSEYIDNIAPIENADGYLGIFGIDPSLICNHISLSEAAYISLMSSICYMKNQINLLEATQLERDHLITKLKDKEAMIEAMASSKFWKLRSIWMRLKKLIRL
jgi:2-polyprenyl-3-methyl-5-hydroxy-6-metoxy-1,4-benzoquinol methylase